MLDYKQCHDVNQSLLSQSIAKPAGAMVTSSGEVIGDVLEKFKDIHEGWNSKIVREEISNGWADFIGGMADWFIFGTLTFKEITGYEPGWKMWRWLISGLNKNLFGKNYINKVGHSYFNYVVGLELQDRGSVHFHFLADQPLNFTLVNALWWDRCGFEKIESIKNFDDAIHYVSKYVSKGGEINFFKRKKPFYPPDPAPIWWRHRTPFLERHETPVKGDAVPSGIEDFRTDPFRKSDPLTGRLLERVPVD